MCDVKRVFVTKEVADMLDITSSYVLRLTKEMKFLPSEMRDTGKRNYLFNEEAVKKIKTRLQQGK